MFIRAYLRASTDEQNADRARSELEAFVQEHGQKIASFYVENESGAKLDRPELMRLIEDAHEGDVILVEQVDRLARLNQKDWDTLKSMLARKKLAVVSKEIPTSHMALKQEGGDEFTDSILRAVNAMLLDMLAAVARKDYEDRRRRQKQGIERAKEQGRYRGRAPDIEKRASIGKMLQSGCSYNEIQRAVRCSRKLIADVAKDERAMQQARQATS